jgi:hypothetical protein
MTPTVIDVKKEPVGGSKGGDWVIVNGTQRVRDAMKVAPKRGPMPGAPAPAAKGEATRDGAKG